MAVISNHITDQFALYNGDCMEVVPTLPDASVGFSVYSPPFADLYAYSNDERDMSNCRDYDEFLVHYGFLVSQIARVTKPGRLSAVHCMDLKKGTFAQKDFPGDIIRLHEREGFHFVSRVTIWKDPWLVARRTRMRSLMHKQIVADSSKVGVAGADYLLVFRKAGENEVPITHPTGLQRYAGETPIPEHLMRFKNFIGDQRKNLLSHWIWRRYASSVWMDIRTGRLLPHREAKENPEEKHVCPLQLDVIERAMTLYSNPGDIVLTPFLGVGSEAYTAVRMGRRAIGIELKTTYFRQAVANVTRALTATDDDAEADLFDDLDAVDDEGFEHEGEEVAVDADGDDGEADS
jgi:DNA modification methylase